MAEKKKKLGLFPRVVIAIVAGILLGYVLPGYGVRVLKTCNVLFAQLLKFIVPLLVLGLVTPAIADVGKGAGKMLLAIMGLSYLSTILAGFWGYGVTSELFPRLIPHGLGDALSKVAEIQPYFTLKIPPVCDVLTALVLAFMTGIGIVFTGSEHLRKTCSDFGEVVKFTILKAIIPMLPFYILTMVCEMAASGKIAALGGTLVKVILVGIGLTLAFLVMLYIVAGVLARKNPMRCLWNMLPAYLTGLSISSSTAVIPVTLECTKRNGVSKDIADFVVPLCANVHLVGAMIKVVINSLAVMWLYEMKIDAAMFANFILMVGISAVAAPGVTGGTLMASLGLMDSILGLNPEQTALVMTFYLAFDGYGPAANVTGDGAIALMINRFFPGDEAEARPRQANTGK